MQAKDLRKAYIKFFKEKVMPKFKVHPWYQKMIQPVYLPRLVCIPWFPTSWVTNILQEIVWSMSKNV